MLTLDQAGALPNSLSPKTAEDGAVMHHPASARFRVRGQHCSLITLVVTPVHPKAMPVILTTEAE